MGSNPYEAPKADISGSVAPQGGGAAAFVALTPDMEMKAMELLGRKRSRLTGIVFAVAGPVCVGLLTFVLGLFLALLVGGALAGAIARGYVKSRTETLAEEVCVELGLAPGSFNPDLSFLL